MEGQTASTLQAALSLPASYTARDIQNAGKGSIATLQEFVDMAAKDQEGFRSSMRIKDEGIAELERQLLESHKHLQDLVAKEGLLEAKVRQGQEEARNLGSKVSSLIEEQQSLRGQVNCGIKLASEAEKEQRTLSKDLANAANRQKDLERKLEESEVNVSRRDQQITEIKTSLEDTRILLALQTDTNRQLREMLDDESEKAEKFQKASSYYEQMANRANASKAQLSAEAEQNICALQRQLDVMRQKHTTAENDLHTSQKLAEQYLQELHDSAAVLSKIQKEADTDSQKHKDEMAAAQQSYQMKLEDLEKQVEASAAMLNQTTTAGEAKVSKLEIKIADLESQLIAQTEEERIKLERLVKETGEQFDKIRNEKEQEIRTQQEKVSVLEGSLAERQSESDHLKVQCEKLHARCEIEIREKNEATDALADHKRKAAEEAQNSARQSADLLEQNQALQSTCASLESQLSAAKSAAVSSERDQCLAKEKINTLQAEIRRLQQSSGSLLPRKAMGVPELENAEGTLTSHGANPEQGSDSSILPVRRPIATAGPQLDLAVSRPSVMQHAPQAAFSKNKDTRESPDRQTVAIFDAKPHSTAPVPMATRAKRQTHGAQENPNPRQQTQQLARPCLRPLEHRIVPGTAASGAAAKPAGQTNKKRKKNQITSSKPANFKPDAQHPRTNDCNVMSARATVADKAEQRDLPLARTCTQASPAGGVRHRTENATSNSREEDGTEPIEGSHEDLFAASIFGDFSRNQLITT